VAKLYSKQTWVDGSAGNTPLSAARLGVIETGIDNIDTRVDSHVNSTTGVHGIADTATLVSSTDARLTNSRTPTAHATTHATGGTDALTALQIGGAARTGGGNEAVVVRTGVTGALTGGSALDLGSGSVFDLTVSGSVTSSTLTNVPSGSSTVTLILRLQGNFTFSWPSGTKWPGGAGPTLTTGGTGGTPKVDIVTLVSVDAGTSWLGFVGAQDVR
jgi:hypothetical protein